MIDAELQNFLIIGFLAVIILAYFMNSFQFLLFALFAGLAAGFILSSWALAGIICALAAGVVFLHFAWQKTKSQAGKSGKSLREGLETEWKKVESAKVQGGVGVKFYEDGLKTLGKKAGEALVAKDGMKYANPHPAATISKGIQNFIDGFNKIFKK